MAIVLFGVAWPEGAAAGNQCLVINEVYADGGVSGAAFNRDFVELLNRCSGPVSLAGLYLYHQPSDDSFRTRLALSGTIGAGRRFLAGIGDAGSSGAPLPAPDQSFPFGLDDGPGKVYLSSDVSVIFCQTTAQRIDLVGYGTHDSPCFEGSGPAPEPTATQSTARTGCADTDDNAADFGLAAPSPENTTAAPLAFSCASMCLVINEVYNEGGVTGAAVNRDFVELLNRCSGPVALTGLYLYHQPSDTSFRIRFGLVGTIGAGRRFLAAIGDVGSSGASLPAPDQSFPFGLDDGPGKVYLSSDVSVVFCTTTAGRIDLVGYGAHASACFEGPGPAPEPTHVQSIARDGCVDTDDNAADFGLGAPTPENTSAAALLCGGPTAATGVQLAAVRAGNGVIVRWTIPIGMRVLGFNVYRIASGERLKVNRRLISTRRSPGNRFSFVDRHAPRGRVVYLLEAVALDGTRRWLGRVQATSQRI